MYQAQCVDLIKSEDFDTHSDENNSPPKGSLFLSPFSDTMDIVFESRWRWLCCKIRIRRKGGRFCYHRTGSQMRICEKSPSSFFAINQYLRSGLNISTESTTIPIPLTPFHQSFAPVSLLPSCFSFVTSTTVPSLHRMRRP